MKTKRLSSFFLALVLSVSLLPTSFAADDNENKVFYYSNYDNDEVYIATGASLTTKSNSITHEFDSDGNGYVNLSVLSGENDCFFETIPKTTKTNKLIVELDISTDTALPKGNLQYKDNSSPRKQAALFEMADGQIFINGQSAGKVKKGKWHKLGFIIDFNEGETTAFVNGKRFAVYRPNTTTNDIYTVRFYVSKFEDNIGKNVLIDNFAVYGGSEFRDVSSEYIAPPSRVVVKAGEDVEMKHPQFADIGAGVALMINKSDAYAKGAMTKVDAENESVVPVIVNDRTLVPVRFISESFDAAVSWNGDTRTATVSTADKTIVLPIDSNTIKINGADTSIDVPATIINDRTMLPLRALVEALGKNVLWDERGLIVITEPEITLDTEKDIKLSTMLIGKLESGVEAQNYAAYPYFNREIIDEAATADCGKWFSHKGNSDSGSNSANIIYYLTLLTRSQPNAAASDGTLCKDIVLKHIRYIISGGNEPFACVGPYWSHAIFASGMLLVKNTPVIYNELTDLEKEKMDWLMRALAIAGNWGYNDLNDYSTGFDLLGNFGKGWNPNYRNTYLSVVITSSMYFGADELNKIYTSFDYDTYIKKYTELGFTNILATWTTAGKELMENGGECTLLGGIGGSYMEAGQSGGSGVGVKIPFTYNGITLDNIHGLFTSLVEYTYAFKVASEYGTPGTYDHTYILSGKKSPFEGQMGMMREFAAGDGGAKSGGVSSIRSRCGYGYDSFKILNTVYANMKLFGGWDSSTKRMRELDNRIYVGTEDLLFKLHEGYYGYSSGGGSNEYEYQNYNSGFKYAKDLWKNFHCMLNEKLTFQADPNETKLSELPMAEPKDNITSAPVGAFSNVQLKNNCFPLDSYYSVGNEMKSGTVEFDIVIGNDGGATDYDCVVMLAKKRENANWNSANMLLQFTKGTIKIRNGNSYIDTFIQFDRNYRYHAKVTFDVTTRKYTVELNQIYPTVGDVFKAENYSFRNGGDEIDFVDSLSVVNSPDDSTMWIENFKIIK